MLVTLSLYGGSAAKTKTNKTKTKNVLDYCSLEALDKYVDGLGLNDFLGQVIPVSVGVVHVAIGCGGDDDCYS